MDLGFDMNISWTDPAAAFREDAAPAPAPARSTLPPPPPAAAATTTSSSSRKRPRSTSPVPPSSKRSKSNKLLENMVHGEELAKQLRASPVSALNSLLKVSTSHELNYALGSNGEKVLHELVRIAHACLEWDVEAATEGETEIPKLNASEAWLEPPTTVSKKWVQHCRSALSNKARLEEFSTVTRPIQALDVVLVILRNLSFVAANIRLLAYSHQVVQLLVGCLWDNANSTSALQNVLTDESSRSTNLCVCAVQTLIHLSPYLDVTGHVLYADLLFCSENEYLPTSSLKFGQALSDKENNMTGFQTAKQLDTKNDVLVDVDQEDVVKQTKDYLTSVWSIFPAIAHVLQDPQTPRLAVMSAVDLLKEFLNQINPNDLVVSSDEHDTAKETSIDMVSILRGIPQKVLEKLIALLWIPRLGPDSLDYMNPVTNIVSRVSTLKLLMGYDATVDTDLRDRSLDVLVPLTELPGLTPRLMESSFLMDVLVPILSTTVGRNDAPNLAGELLGQLAKAPNNTKHMLYIQERMLDLASRGDVRVAQLVCNHMYNPKKEGKEKKEVAEEAEEAVEE